MLPQDVTQYLLVEHLYEYAPCIRHVCKDWRRMITNAIKPTQSSKTIPLATKKCCMNDDDVQTTQSLEPHRKLWSLSDIAANGHTNLLKWIFSLTPRTTLRFHTVQQILTASAQAGHETTLLFLHEYFAKTYNVWYSSSKVMLGSAMAIAASNGHKQIVCLCKNLGADNVDGAFYHAVKANNWSIILMCAEWGVSHWTIESASEFAGKFGNEDMLRLLRLCGLKSYNTAMVAAAENGHENIMRLCKEQYAAMNIDVRIGAALIAAARQGHEHIIRFCLQWAKPAGVGAALIEAAQRGHVEIVKLLMHCNIYDQYRAIDYAGSAAAANGHEYILTLLINLPKNIDFNYVIRGAARGGKIHLVELCKERGATDFNRAMEHAAEGGHMTIVHLCKKWGARNYNEAMEAAARGGNEQILRQCKEWGANAYEGALENSAQMGHENIVRLCKKWGARNYRAAMRMAAKYGHVHIVQLVYTWGVDQDTVNVAMETGVYCKREEVVRICIEEMGARVCTNVIRCGAEFGESNLTDYLKYCLLIQQYPDKQ